MSGREGGREREGRMDRERERGKDREDQWVGIV